jgi:uncharacterized protein YkwD
VLASPNTHRTYATRIGLLVAAALVLGGAWLTGPAPVAASTATTAATMESQILTFINADRAAAGLQALRRDSQLVTWSADRSSWMATHGSLTHTSWGGAPCTLYQNQRIKWYGCGEAIGNTTASFGSTAASFLYALWKNSPDHEALIMSKSYNYVGIGVSYRSSTHTTYASILFLEGPDISKPTAALSGPTLNGRSIHWSWSATDPVLQTHTAGIKDFDVQIRVDGKAWVNLRSNTTVTSETTPGERPGSTWALRVRADDRAGNASAWVTSATVVIP